LEILESSYCQVAGVELSGCIEEEE